MNATALDVLMARAANMVDGYTEGKVLYPGVSKALYELEVRLDDEIYRGTQAERMGHTLLSELEERIRVHHV